jgi:hypothetical protein
MYPPVIYTNREIVNYSKEDIMNVMHLCNKPCYSSSKERGTDEIFWTFFHQDWYWTVLYPKSSLVVKQQYVDIEYMRNKKDMHFTSWTIQACFLGYAHVSRTIWLNFTQETNKCSLIKTIKMNI